MSSTGERRIVEAEQFVVRDKNNVIRATLGCQNAWESPMLNLYDEKGIQRMCIELIDGYPAMRFMMASGNPLFSFGKTRNGSPIIGVGRNDATPAVLIIAEEGKDVKIGVCRSDGEPVWLKISDIPSDDDPPNEW